MLRAASDACAAQRTGVNATAVAACGVSEPPAAVAARCTSSESGGGACGVVDEGASPSSAPAAASRLRRNASSARLTSRGLRLRVAKPRTLRNAHERQLRVRKPRVSQPPARTCRPARAAAAAAQPPALTARRAERTSRRCELRREASGAARRVAPPPSRAAAAQQPRSRAALPWTGPRWRVRPSRAPSRSSTFSPLPRRSWRLHAFAAPAGTACVFQAARCNVITRTRGAWRGGSAADERAGAARPRLLQPAACCQAAAQGCA